MSSSHYSPPSHDHGPELPLGDNKCRRMDDHQGPAATAESSASAPSREEVLAYAEEIMQQYTAANAARGRGRGRTPTPVLSFDSLFPRTTNAAQKAVRDAYLEWTMSLFKFLLDEDEAFDPSAPLWEYINRAHKLMSIENGGRHTYFEERRKKGGGACNGTTRSGYYAELCEKLGLDYAKLVSIINFNNLTVKTQRELTKRLLEGLAQFLPQISQLPDTIKEMWPLTCVVCQSMQSSSFGACAKHQMSASVMVVPSISAGIL